MDKRSWQVVTYNIQEVSLEQLKSIHMGDEGLVALGAGGDLKQWIDGITEDLNASGIASGDANTLFKAFFKLTTTEGRTDLVMVFNTDADMNLSKMALWRLQWGGELSWISDWFNNYASHFASMNKRSWQIQKEEEPYRKYSDEQGYYNQYSMNTYKTDDDQYEVYFSDDYIELIQEALVIDQYDYPAPGGIAPINGEDSAEESGVYNSFTYLEFYANGKVITQLSFSDMTQTSSLKFSWLDSSNTHQELMDEAYKDKPQSESREDFHKRLSPLHRDAVILGNLNYQVGNGGFEQWYGNGYGAGDEDYLVMELLPKIGTEAAIKVLKLVGTAMTITEEKQEYDEQDPNDDPYGSLDDAYYEINDQFVLDANDYLVNIRNASLNKRAASSQEEQYIFKLLQQIAPKYRDPEDAPAVTPEAAEIIANWYAKEFEEILKITPKYLFQDLLDLRDAASDFEEIKTVWPNFQVEGSLKFSWEMQPFSFADAIMGHKLEVGDFMELEGYPEALIDALDYDNHTISLQFQEDGPINLYKFDVLNDRKVKDFTAMSSLQVEGSLKFSWEIQPEPKTLTDVVKEIFDKYMLIDEPVRILNMVRDVMDLARKYRIRRINYLDVSDAVRAEGIERDWDIRPMASLNKQSWEIQAPTIYNVKARSYERAHPNIPIGQVQWEEIDISNNRLFEDAKNAEDVKRIYESFWNALSPNSEAIVKVIEIEPVKISKKENTMKKKADMDIDEKGRLVEDGETQKFRQDLIEEQIPTGEPQDLEAMPEAQYESSPDALDMDFHNWFEENKDSDLLWEEYNNYVLESSQEGEGGAESFNVWMRNRFDALYSNQQKGLKKIASKFEELKIALIQKFNFDPSLLEGQNDLYEIIAQLGPAEGITEGDILQVVGQIIPFDENRLDNIEDETEIEDFINELDGKLKTSYFNQQKGLKKIASSEHFKQWLLEEANLHLKSWQEEKDEEQVRKWQEFIPKLQEASSTEHLTNLWAAFTGDSAEGVAELMSDYIDSQASQKVANGIAVNILPNLFEDKFPLGDTPRELMLLRSKAKQALTGISKKLTLSGRDATPADFPVEWFYKNFSYASPEGPAMNYNNYVTEVRAQLQDIIDYGNSITGENFYAGMETTIYKISRNGEKGVKILREKIDGKINRYGYINEKNTFVVLPNHRELRKTSKLQRPDTGENITIISYEDFSLGSATSLIEELIQKKSWGYENPQDIEAQEEEAENPYSNVSENTGGDDLFTYLKERYNKIQQQVDNIGMNINKLQTEVNEHISTWPEEAQQRVKNVMTALINHELIKEAFDESDAEVGSPKWVDAMLSSADNLDYEMAKRVRAGEDTTYYVTDLLLDAAKEQGVQANSADALRWFDDYHESPLFDAHFSKLNRRIPKYSIDVSDDIPPMGWNTSDPGKPAGSGAPKEPLQSLQDDENADKAQDANVLYDSKQDTGPQYQVTMNPKNKEVSIKFMDSPEQEALKETIQEDTSIPQVTPLDQLPKLNTTPSAGGVQEDPSFKGQEVPVTF